MEYLGPDRTIGGGVLELRLCRHLESGSRPKIRLGTGALGICRVGPRSGVGLMARN